MMIKELARKVLTFLHIDITKNLQYDRLTNVILKQTLASNSNCIDVGCHKGEILDLMLNYAPNGMHFGFEPIPVLYENLKFKYSSLAKILPYALSHESSTASFNYVKNDPAYSGLQKRNYDRDNPIIEQIQVDVKRLDDIIPIEVPIALIKIDVEGGEFGVLKGASAILKSHKPLLIFESGKGASDYYGTKPEELYNYLVNDYQYQIYTLSSFLNGQVVLSLELFVQYFNTNEEYYFVGR